MAIGDKPADVPEWASGANADILIPDAGKRALGYSYREKPGRKVLNWLLNLTYQWFAFLTTRFNALGWLSLGAATAHIAAIDRSGAIDFTADGSTTTLMTATITRGRAELRVGQELSDTEGAVLTAALKGSGLAAEILQVSSVDAAKRIGVSAGAFKPLAVGAASADYKDTAFPLAQSLYLDNTPKIVAQLLISATGTTYDTVAVAGGYNITSASIVLTTPRTINVVASDTWGGQYLLFNVAPQPGGTLPFPAIFAATGLTAITAIAWNGSAWVDLFSSGLAATLGGPLRVNIVGF